jgi:hypothetical protein
LDPAPVLREFLNSAAGAVGENAEERFMRIRHSRAILCALLVLLLALAATTGRSGQKSSTQTVVPRGTVIMVRTIDPIRPKNAKAGDTFRAAVDEPVLVNGREVIPRGADAQIRLYQANSKSEDLALKLYSVNVRGRQAFVNSDFAVVTPEKKGMSTGAKTAIGAGIGAAVGAIAGGGKGAAIGAGAGAGTGLVISKVKGRDTEVKPETRLSFTIR